MQERFYMFSPPLIVCSQEQSRSIMLQLYQANKLVHRISLQLHLDLKYTAKSLVSEVRRRHRYIPSKYYRVVIAG